MTQLNSIQPSFRRQQRESGGFTNSPALIKPNYSIREEPENYQVAVNLPGVTRDGLEVQAEQNELIIVGRRSWRPPTGWTALHLETPQGDFGLTLDHEGKINAEKISAELKEGVLRITLPKAEALKPRRIAIQ